MSDEEKNDRQWSRDFLKSHGWDDEKSERFLNDEVGTIALQIPGNVLLDVLREACQEGIPIGTVRVDFLVPNRNWTVFKERVQEAISKRGGFMLTPEQKAALEGIEPGIAH